MTRKHIFSSIRVAALIAMVAVTATAQDLAQQKSDEEKLERLLVAAQKICPVIGKDLTKMGGPVKAKVGEQNVFLCCKGCFEGKIKKATWDLIDKNLIAAQGKCPVMGKELPDDPASIVVNGRKVFVCCPPCTGKIDADPDKHLAVVNELLKENLKREGVLQPDSRKQE